MQTLSDRQLREVTRIIEDHHAAFLVNIGLGDEVDETRLERLKRLGLVGKTVTKSVFEDAYTFGLVADALEEGAAKNLSYADFKNWLSTNYRQPPTKEDRATVKQLRRSFSQAVRGLEGRVKARTHETVLDADMNLRRKLLAAVTAKVTEAVEHKRSLDEVAASLRKETASHARDWSRLVVTELNNAFQEGKLATIQKSNKGSDPLVFKRVRPDACDECKEAYVTKKGVPRLFRLSELIAAGSNVHRHKSDRRATVKSLHPWCQCELQEMPPGFEFDGSGKMVYVGF